MAFNPDRLSLFAQPIGDGGIRFFNYETDENEDVILGTSYFEDAEERGLRPYDLIFVSPLSGTREPYILTVELIDGDGDATVVDGSRVSTSIPRYLDRAAVGDAKIPPTVDNIFVQAFDADVDPSVGRAYYKAATDAEYTAMPALLRLTDANGRKFVINEPEVHVDMAGADSSGATDSSAAFQACADYIKARMSAGPSGDIDVSPTGISWAKGTYKIASSIDMQEIDGYAWTLDGTGGVIHLTCAGKTGFDLLGSRWCTGKNITIIGDNTLSPAIGIQIGRLTSSTDPGDCHSFYNLQMSGTFTRSSVYSLASETDLWVQPALYNEDATGNAYVFIMDGYNYWEAITDFTAPAFAANTNLSCIQHTFVSADFRNRGSGNAFWCTRTDQLKFLNGYMVSQDAYAAVFFDNGNGFADIHFDVHCEQHTVAPGLQHNIYFDRISAGDTSVVGFKFNEEWSAAAVSPIGVSATIGTLRLINAEIIVDVIGQAPSTGNLFNDTAVVVTGNIYLPTTGIQTGNIALNGGLYGPAVASVVMPRGSVTLHDQGVRAHYKGGRLFWGDEANPSVAGDYATSKNVYIQDGVLYIRGDASNVNRIRFTTGPANTTILADIVPGYASGNLNVQVGSVIFGLRADGTIALPSLGGDPGTATDGSIWNVGGVLRKRTGGANSNVG